MVQDGVRMDQAVPRPGTADPAGSAHLPPVRKAPASGRAARVPAPRRAFHLPLPPLPRGDPVLGRNGRAAEALRADGGWPPEGFAARRPASVVITTEASHEGLIAMTEPE